MRRILPLIICLLTFLLSVPAALAASPPVFASGHVLLVEPASGTVLYEKAAHERAYPASITKIMTTLLVLENLSLDDQVTVSQTAFFDIAADGSSAGLLAGEILTVRDLLYCIMVVSANEACNVAAEAVSGSVEAFVELMNARAAELGLEDTHFTNTHGLHDDNHYTTAWDIYHIVLEALGHPEFMEIANTASFTLPATNMHDTERVFYTTNHLISKYKNPDYIYFPARGIKTGHHSTAGHCLTSSASNKELSLVSVVLNSPVFPDGKIGSFVETRELLEWGLSNFTHKTIITSKEVLGELPVELGQDLDAVTLVPDGEIGATVAQDLDPDTIERVLSLHPMAEGGLTAPVKKGDVLGVVTLKNGDLVYGSLPVVAGFDVERSEFDYIVNEATEFIAQPWILYVGLGVGVLFVGYIVFAILHNRKRRRNRSAYSNYRGKKR